MRKSMALAGTARLVTVIAVLALLTTSLAFSGVALAMGSMASVTGTYTYWIGDHGRTVTVDARGTDPVSGTWSRIGLSGSVTCLVVDGQDAWMAGPSTTSGLSAFFWVHDGGVPGGAGDMAVTWITDPGETLADMEALCLAKSTTLVGLFPVVSGDVIVSAQANSTYATSETGGTGSNVGATGAPNFDYAAAPAGLYTQLDTPAPGTSMTASFAPGSVCLANSSVDLVLYEAGTSDPLMVTVNGFEATMVGSETPYSVGGPPNPDGTIRSYDVPAAAGPFTTVAILATRTNPRPYAEIDAVECVNTFPFLSPVHAWVGLKSSDDQGAKFDLRAELVDQNGNVVATGLTRCVAGVTRNPSLAQEVTVAWDSFSPVPVQPTDEFALRLSTRIGTNPNNTKCAPGPGGSHNSAVGLRLYYDSTNRLSRFDMTVGSGAIVDQYLHSNGNACANAQSVGATTLTFDETVPTAPAAKCKDSSGVSFAGANPWKEIGTWAMPTPG